MQDAGAQLAAPLLDARDGMRVLDACAAPGGKTTHIARARRRRPDGRSTATRRGSTRVRENLARLRLAGAVVRVVVGDAGAPAGWWDGQPFDRILADVPCTASGVVRRHPGHQVAAAQDATSRRSPRSSGASSTALWPLLAPGGRLLYATCSVFAAENELQINDFLREHPAALRETISFPADCAARRAANSCLRGMAQVHNQDGFFYALLRKA